MLRLRAATLLAVFALSACSAGAVPTSSVPPATASATALPLASAILSATALPVATATSSVSTPSATRTATAVPPAGGVILLEEGCGAGVARCENMAAGTYETSGTWAFLRGLTVTLPPGWSSGEQDAGEFMLHQAPDVASGPVVFFWRDLVAWVDGAPRPDLGTSADEFADYLLGDARLTVVEGPSRTFRVRGPDSLAVAGTVQARSLSVIVSASAKSDADFSDCPGEACVNLFIDPVHWPHPANLGRNLAAPADVPGFPGCPCSHAWRLYVASISPPAFGREPHPHMFVVAVEALGPDPLQTLSAWEAEVDPIIDSVLVPYIIVDN